MKKLLFFATLCVILLNVTCNQVYAQYSDSISIHNIDLRLKSGGTEMRTASRAMLASLALTTGGAIAAIVGSSKNDQNLQLFGGFACGLGITFNVMSIFRLNKAGRAMYGK